MNFLTKKCEICETKINKLQSLWNIYALKAGKRLKCPKCNTEYKTYSIISFFGFFMGGEASFFFLLVLSVTVPFIFEKFFNIDFGWVESWILAFISLNILEFFLMVILPLRKIKEERKEVEDGTN